MRAFRGTPLFYQKLAFGIGPARIGAMGAIWTVLLGASLVVAAVNGRMGALTAAALDSAAKAVTLSLGLAGAMALWLGLMKVAEEAGLVRALARAARPVLVRLFPEVPADHPAMGAMLMNLSANALGLGNAATPFGVKAMQALEELNPRKGTASDAQALLCALNTASVQLVPASVIALRAAAGSRAPAEILGATLCASACGVVVAVVAAKALRRLYLAAAPAGPEAAP
ncbi:nucleoside recognition domain-containing protein [Anaeromyxobacter dehalogenans]|nr:nucleoside recognition domain-containing protein [Anaeromyxobacter dehalogenans]